MVVTSQYNFENWLFLPETQAGLVGVTLQQVSLQLSSALALCKGVQYIVIVLFYRSGRSGKRRVHPFIAACVTEQARDVGVHKPVTQGRR
jgi:hypothetical protein